MCAYNFETTEATNRPIDNQANLNATMLNDAYFNRVMQPNFAQPNSFMPANNGYRAMEYVPPQVMRQLNTGYPDFSAFYINPMQQQQNYFRQMQMREMMMQARFNPNTNRNFNPNHCQCPHFDNRFTPRWQQREVNPMERPHWRQDIEQPHRRRRDWDRDRDNRDFPRRPNTELPPTPNNDTPANGELRPQDVRRRDGNQPIPQNERRALMILALKTAGVEPSEANIRGLNTIIEKESGWKPNIVNNWDSNAKKGTPSKGLMQTIGPTFDSYKMAGYDDILNPLHNMIAGIRYATKRYGHLLNVPGLKSMAAGGPYKGY